MGGACAQDPSRLCSQQLRRRAPAESRKSPRDCSASSIFLLPRLRVVCVRVCVCARAPTRMCPPTRACSYLLAAAATGAMAAKDAEPADCPPHGGTAAQSRARRMAIEGQEAGKPLSLMLITELP